MPDDGMVTDKLTDILIAPNENRKGRDEYYFVTKRTPFSEPQFYKPLLGALYFDFAYVCLLDQTFPPEI